MVEYMCRDKKFLNWINFGNYMASVSTSLGLCPRTSAGINIRFYKFSNVSEIN